MNRVNQCLIMIAVIAILTGCTIGGEKAAEVKASGSKAKTSFNTKAVTLSVECKNVRIGSESAKINPAFEDTHAKWVISCPSASATKVTETSTGVQWRIKPLKKDFNKVTVQYRDKFNQQYTGSLKFENEDDSAQLTIKRRFNTLKIESGGSASAVFFAKVGSKDRLTDKDKCSSRGNGLYDFPAIWQGPQRAWSLYIKSSSGVKEIPGQGNFYGVWGNFVYVDKDGKEAVTPKGTFRKITSN